MKLTQSRFGNTPISRKKAKEVQVTKEVYSPTLDGLDNITTIEELHKFIKEFPSSPLKETANSTVISSGPLSSPLMIVGEAPGADEDAKGLPFVGRSGRLINEELKRLDIDREKVYVSNIVNWRPPGNRTPTLEEINLFKPIIKKHIDLIKPKILLLLGSTSMNALYNTDLPISKARGVLKPYNAYTEVLVTFHPSYILRSEKNRKFLREDLELIRSALVKADLLNHVIID